MNQSRVQNIVSNSNITIIPFRWFHPRGMNLRPFDVEAFQQFNDFEERLRAMESYGNCWTAIYQGKMICCWGAYEIWDGVAEAWLITSYDFERVPISVTRGAMRFFDETAITMKLHRLQLTVNTNDKIAVRWAKVLKFDYEGLMRAYGPDGSDYIIVARLYK